MFIIINKSLKYHQISISFINFQLFLVDKQYLLDNNCIKYQEFSCRANYHRSCNNRGCQRQLSNFYGEYDMVGC